jgi:hypothetical protein
MLNKIVDFAKKDTRIRAAVLNGSRVSPSATQDKY